MYIFSVENEEQSTSVPVALKRKSDENWNNYTTKMLKQPKNKKLEAPNRVQNRTLYSLKQGCLKEKLNFLLNEEKRKQEYHEKQMELIQIQIDEKRMDTNK